MGPNRFTPQNSGSEGLYQSCSKNCEISHFGFFPFLLSFSLTWDFVGVKVSNDISCESMHQIYSPKFMYIHGEGLYQVVKRIVKFEIMNF